MPKHTLLLLLLSKNITFSNLQESLRWHKKLVKMIFLYILAISAETSRVVINFPITCVLLSCIFSANVMSEADVFLLEIDELL